MSKNNVANNSLALTHEGFVPTWLYVKKCTHCGLMYFGKTIKEPKSYKGSGAYWHNHCNKYGWDKTRTLFTKLFTDPMALRKAALDYSAKHNIVKALMPNGKKLWANLKAEDGFDGGSVPGTLHRASRKKISKGNAGRTQYYDPVTGKEFKLLPNDKKIKELSLVKGRTEQTRKIISEVHKGKPKDSESIAKMVKSRKGQRPYHNGVDYWLLRDDDPRIKKEKLIAGLPEWRTSLTSGCLNGMYGKTHSEEVRRLLSEAGRSKDSLFIKNNPMKNPELARKHSDRMKKENPSRGKSPYNDGVKNFWLDPLDPSTKKKKLMSGHIRIRWYYRTLDNSRHAFLKSTDNRIKRDGLVLCKDQTTALRFRPGQANYCGASIA